MRTCTALFAVAILTACTHEPPRSVATTPSPPWRDAVQPTASYLGNDLPGLPAVTDIGVAWDQVDHRGPRWLCRAVPSGNLVDIGLCAGAPRNDARWPGHTPPANWSGLVQVN